MIFLDANAFYSYYGRSKLGMTSEPVDEERLKKYLEQQREKSLPTSVYIEIMTHFRNNPKVLQNLLEFRYAKGLPLFNNIPDYVVSEDEITSVAYMDQAALKNYADRLLKSKIQIESKFTLLFFEITKDLYAHYKLEMTDGLSQKNKDAILGYIGRVAYKEYQNLLEERIKVELQSGYDENKEKKVLKDFYIQELNEACVLTNIIIQGCVACKQDNNKTELAIAVCASKWKAYLDKLDEARPISSIHDIPAIGRFIFTLDSYIGMYQNHKDLLQYNDNFNNYITHQTVRQEELANFHASLNSVNTRLHMMYAKAKEDKTFRTDIPEEQFMRVTVHTMMAACTHYAGGFIWGATDNKDYTGDLLLLKEMILNYARNDANL